MPKAVSADSQKAFEGQVPLAALLNAFDTNSRINLYLIENLAPQKAMFGMWGSRSR